MRIYRLTSVGIALASNPSHNPSPAMRVAYFMKRHGNQASDDQIRHFALNEDDNYYKTINSLIRAKAIAPVG